MAFDQSGGRGRFGPPQDTWQALADFAPTLLGTLFGLRPQGQGAQSYGAPQPLTRLGQGAPATGIPRQGEPGYDPDQGMRLDLGPSTAVPMPNPYPGPGTGVRMPEYGPGDVEVDGTRFKEPEGGWYGGNAGGGGQAEPGPAKASRFRDPRTGKFDYWGWLDAGMANLGKGGVLFEDDTPDVNAREGILDKPAAMTAAGASENSRMPEESRFEARGAEQGYGLGRPVAYAAQDGGGGAPADGGGAGSGASAREGQAGTPAQPQGPAQQPFGENTRRKAKQRMIDERIVRESESGPMNEPYDPESVAVRGRGGESLSPELKERIRARLQKTPYANMDLDSLKLYRGRTPWYMPSDKEGITLENHIYMKDGKFAPEMNDYHFNQLVEEAVHAGQFQDKMTRPGYLWESLKNGYEKNSWEKKAWDIAYPDGNPHQRGVVSREPLDERNLKD